MFDILLERKLTIGQLLTLTYKVFKELLLSIIVLGFLFYLPYEYWLESTDKNNLDNTFIILIQIIIGFLVTTLISTIIITSLKLKISGDNISFSNLITTLFLKNYVKFLIATAISAFFIVISSAFLILPGLAALTLFSFLPQPIIFKSFGPWKALKYSITLVKQRFSFVLVITIIHISVSTAIPLLFDSFSFQTKLAIDLLLYIPEILYILAISLLFVHMENSSLVNEEIAITEVLPSESNKVSTYSESIIFPTIITLPISKTLLSKLRHPKEQILYITCVFLNLPFIAIYFTILIFLIIDCFNNFTYIKSLIEKFNNYNGVKESQDTTFTVVQGIVVFVFLPMSLIFFLGKLYGEIRSSSIKITRKQFGDIYEIADNLAKRIGLDSTPEIYLQQNGGFINAFTARFRKNNFIQIWAELFEIAYLENKDFDTLAFIIAHEMAHIKLKHTSVRNMYSIFFIRIIPILNLFGNTLSRAREYSCDRIASHLVPQGRDGFMILVAGKRLYKLVDIEDFLTESNQKGFFVWLYNILSTHPIPTKRFRALKEIAKPKLF